MTKFTFFIRNWLSNFAIFSWQRLANFAFFPCYRFTKFLFFAVAEIFCNFCLDTEEFGDFFHANDCQISCSFPMIIRRISWYFLWPNEKLYDFFLRGRETNVEDFFPATDYQISRLFPRQIGEFRCLFLRQIDVIHNFSACFWLKKYCDIFSRLIDEFQDIYSAIEWRNLPILYP